jgi:hypothetical protein
LTVAVVVFVVANFFVISSAIGDGFKCFSELGQVVGLEVFSGTTCARHIVEVLGIERRGLVGAADDFPEANHVCFDVVGLSGSLQVAKLQNFLDEVRTTSAGVICVFVAWAACVGDTVCQQYHETTAIFQAISWDIAGVVLDGLLERGKQRGTTICAQRVELADALLPGFGADGHPQTDVRLLVRADVACVARGGLVHGCGECDQTKSNLAVKASQDVLVCLTQHGQLGWTAILAPVHPPVHTV